MSNVASGPDYGLGHCVHHDVHWEYLWSLLERRKYICRYKSAEERPLRLALLALVPAERLPKAVREAVAAVHRAWNAWKSAAAHQGDAYRRWNETYDALVVVLRTHALAMRVLHTKLYPECPWNGHTIFSARGGF